MNNEKQTIQVQSQEPAKPEWPEFIPYSVGFISASVCSRLSIEETTKRLNYERPTGITSQWTLSTDKTFATGEPQGCQCPDHPDNKHYLFTC